MGFKDKFIDFQEIQVSENLILRQPNPDTDANDYFEILLDAEAFKYYEGYRKPPKDINDSKKICHSAVKAFHGARIYEWAVVNIKAEKVIGRIHLSDFQNNNSAANIGYYLKRDYWGSGIISSCINSVVEFGFNDFDLERIFTTVAIDNVGSWKALEKNGFIREGTLRKAFMTSKGLCDCHIYSKLRTDS